MFVEVSLVANACSEAYIVVGKQTVAKFNEQAKNDVSIFMFLARLPSYSTDIVITFNVPSKINPASSSAKVVDHLESADKELALFQQIVKSFQILDYGLFG